MEAPDRAFVDAIAGPLRLLRGYSRLRVEGVEHVPRQGGAILPANHTGWIGLDYAFAASCILDCWRRIPRGLVHPAWFRAPLARQFALRVGLVEVSKGRLKALVEEGELVMLFPEGERAAFRPGQGYVLEPFARGFVRVAMETGAPVVPVAILGGAEANPVRGRMAGYEQMMGLAGGLPIPGSIMPRPVKWRIRFLPPRAIHGDPGDAPAVHAAADAVRAEVAEALQQMTDLRGNRWM